MEVVEERFAFGEHSVIVARPARPGDMIDEERFATDEYMPYWAEVWPAGVELARLVATLELRGRQVLELGCGLALPSLVAALRGARVMAIDWSPEAIEILEQNAARNGACLRTRVVDWRQVESLATDRFDLVLAADVLYEERNVRPVLDVLAVCLAEGGDALVADPGRRHAAGFADRAGLAGFASEDLPHGLRDGGRLLRLRRDRRPSLRQS